MCKKECINESQYRIYALKEVYTKHVVGNWYAGCFEGWFSTKENQFWFSIALGLSLLLVGITMLLRPSEVLKTAEWTKTKSGY